MLILPPTDAATATAQVVDACMRLQYPYRIAPYDIKPIALVPVMISGPVVPVRHYGSVDIFLEVLEYAPENGILVIDNQNRKDEACIGDLVVLEAKNAGIQAIVVNGLHRDTADLRQIGLPVFSCGTCPAGPTRLDRRDAAALHSACFERFQVTPADTAFLDQDGVVFVETPHVDAVLEVAGSIRERERKQALETLHGVTLREQFQFQTYLTRRDTLEEYTFRQHLSSLSKSIEE